MNCALRDRPALRGRGEVVRPAAAAGVRYRDRADGVMTYLAGERRIAFDTQGIVRPYPELGGDA